MTYDLLVIGGGIAGATLAKVMADEGARVLVVEREAQFKDRVRGEGIHPWGVAELKRLGLYDLVMSTCGQELQYWTNYYNGRGRPRDFLTTSPHVCGEITVHHPELQEALLEAAALAGAEVRRKALALSVTPGEMPTAEVRWQGRVEEIGARMIALADGRASSGRKWAGFDVKRDPPKTSLAGVLMSGLNCDPASVHEFGDPKNGHGFLVFPLPEDRYRVYYAFSQSERPRVLSGDRKFAEFTESTIDVGAPPEWYEGSEKIGPLAMFDTSDTWVDHPHRDNVVLIGDAASSNDPTWGNGQSLVFRGVRVLRDALLGTSDWTEAGDAYAEEHVRYYGSIHRITNWLVEMYLEVGPEADARRVRALSRPREERFRPDHMGEGPEAPSDEDARRRFFGE